ncbi:proline rich transmembrane protein 1B-like [Dendropsophus ebraccatus]|uniref:proline rich transmembrane protein 1B-like n=1 Tax=Dendropsophus ebraccatus TaxID=150705 RepID=UPI00383194E7
MDPWKPHERSMNPGYEEPPPSYSSEPPPSYSSEPPPLTRKSTYPAGVGQSSRIPTTLVYSQGSPPPYSALPPNTAYVYPPYPAMATNGLPPNIVITTAPSRTAPPRTKDYMSFSILSLFLCLPLGVVALIYSIKTRSAVKRGDEEAAVEASHKALSLNKISRFGILIIITLVSILLFYFIRRQFYTEHIMAG